MAKLIQLSCQNKQVRKLGFEVLTAVSMKVAVFRALIMKAAKTSETLVIFYQTTRRYNPEDSHLQVRKCAKFWHVRQDLTFVK
jgi:hypothetical protein